MQKASDIDNLTEAVRSCLLLADAASEGQIPSARGPVENLEVTGC